MLDELGPTFVKFGQLLSTRPDVVPPDIIAELRGLQDDVRPFPFAEVERDRGGARAADRAALPRVRPAPMAAASIGQVHRAVLPNGHRVAVKVQRPDAPRQIEADLALLYQAASSPASACGRSTSSTRGLVDEFARSIRQELDYRARRATPRRSAATSPDPRAHPARLLELHAPPRAHARVPRRHQLADLDPETSLDERRELAYLMTEAWMTMIFRHGFFHGDPHPANILVLGRPDRIGLVDFGLAGKLTDDDMSKLTRLFIDAANENVDALPRRLAELGVRYPTSARRSSAPSCASSTTATTARASPRSTRSR